MNLAGYFSDPDGDVLTYGAASSDMTIASVAVSGSVLTVAGVASGAAAVTVTATDGGGLSAQQSFAVTVPNRAPAAVGEIGDQEVAVGGVSEVDVAGHFSDPDGDDLEFGAASSDTTRVRVAVSGSVLTVAGVASGAAAVTVTATDGGGLSAQQSFAVTVPNRAPAAVGEIGDQEVAVGGVSEVDVAGHFSDPDGDSLEFGAASSDTTRVRVAVSGSVLTVGGVAAGTAAVTVTATDGGGLSAQQSFAVTVPNRAPEVTDTIPPQILTVGETRSWAGSEYFSDPDGDPLMLTASTTNTSVIQASASEYEFEILAVAPGTATVTVTATDPEGLGANQSIQVTSEIPGSLVISHVAPATLLEGAQATISGFGFSSVPGDNEVVIGSLAATVTASSATRLSVTVPYSDCLPPRRAELRVTVQGDSDARLVGVSPRSKEDIDLPVGWYRYTYGGNGCLHLPGDDAGGAYVIGVVSISEEPASLTSVAATSIVGDPTVVAGQSLFAYSAPLREAVAPAPRIPLTRAAVAAPAGAATPPRQQITRGPRDWERPHNDVMNRNRGIVRRMGRVDPVTARARATLAPSVSDTLTLFAGGMSCSARDEIRAVVRRIGDHTVWLDDIENPSGTFTDSELAGLDAFYGARVKGVHNDYFGGLSDVDGDGRVTILMTKQANRQDDRDSFLGGWVWFGDLYPSGECATSNQAEILFGRVPDPAGVFGQAWTKEQTLSYYPSLLTHEIAHLAQGAALVFGGADFTTWELEGGATLAEQLVAYGLFGHESGRNMGYEQWSEGRDWYEAWAFGLARFFGWDSNDPTNTRRIPNAPEECSWIGSPEEGNDGPCTYAFRAVYDVPSMVLRFAMDRWGGEYPGGEKALMHRLMRSPTRGLASLADVSDWRAEQILADFYMSLWIDLNGWDAFGMNTWDLDDIWSRFGPSQHLQPHESTFAEFTRQWNVRAGSSSYLEWSPGGSRGPTSIRVTSASGASIPDHISIWAFRVR
ncbi:MAG: hypothetical protein OXN97_07820 [Bryobacterales bacterium]|nr:hypothetical protein [Bryobacterales bacterium]